VINWQPIETAPKDGCDVLLFCPRDGYVTFKIGSYRCDDNDFDGSEGPLWLDDSYDSFSCGYASTPLKPTHWAALAAPTSAVAA
jgi:hypothetical protein